MGISLALPSAMPHEGNRETTGLNLLDLGRLTDGDLIRRVARRDANAFEALYHRFARPVFGLALRRLGDRMRAEDAVQETFAAVWRSARTYKPDRGAGAPWLYAVARNAIVDRSRSRSEPPGEVPDIASTELGPDERGCTAPSRVSRRTSETSSSSPTTADFRRAKSQTSLASRSVP